MSSDELVEHRQLGAVHIRTRSQSRSVTAVLALPLASVLLPVVMNATTLRADDTFLLSV